MTDRKFTPPTEFPAKYRTDHGCDVTIFGRVEGADRSLVGAVHSAGEDREITSGAWSESGVFNLDAPSCLDLQDAPKTKTVWVNFYDDPERPNAPLTAYIHSNEAAARNAGKFSYARKKFTITKGEGL